MLTLSTIRTGVFRMSGQHYRSQQFPTIPSGSYRTGRGGIGISPKIIIAIVVGVVLIGGGAIVLITVISNVAEVASAASGMATARERADGLRKQALTDINTNRYHDPRECELQMVMYFAQAATLAYGEEGERALHAVAATTGRLHEPAGRYYNAARMFLANGDMHPDKMRDRASVQRQLDLIRTLADANRELQQGWVTLPDQIRQDLTHAGVSTNISESIVREVRDGLRLTARPLYHDTFSRYCDSIARVLEHLDGYWGKWRYDERANLIEFEGPTAYETYESLRRQSEQMSRTLLQRANDVYAGPA